MKLELETWNWTLKLTHEIELEIETWNWNLKLKLEIETWNWNIKLDLNFGPNNVYNKFWFWKESPIFVWNRPQLGPFCPFFPFRAIFGVGVRFKNFLVTFLYRQSTLILEVQPHLLFLKHPYLGSLSHFFLALRGYFFALWGYFWGWGQVQIHFWNLLM